MLKSNAFSKTQQRTASAMSVPYTMYDPLYYRAAHTNKAYIHDRKIDREHVLVSAAFTVLFFKRSTRKKQKIYDERSKLIGRCSWKGGDLL